MAMIQTAKFGGEFNEPADHAYPAWVKLLIIVGGPGLLWGLFFAGASAALRR
jgi:hypothetical protein